MQVLNNSTLTLSQSVGSLSSTLQQLALPNLVNTTGTQATAPVLNLDIAALPTDSTPPVDVNLLGLVVTTNNIHAQLSATTGSGNILGNIVYNVTPPDLGGSLQPGVDHRRPVDLGGCSPQPLIIPDLDPETRFVQRLCQGIPGSIGISSSSGPRLRV